jgi:hypothetical protein
MNQHRQAMQYLGANYTVHNLNVQQNYAPRANVEQAEFKKITRSCSIYKPSFNIVTSKPLSACKTMPLFSSSNTTAPDRTE